MIHQNHIIQHLSKYHTVFSLKYCKNIKKLLISQQINKLYRKHDHRQTTSLFMTKTIFEVARARRRHDKFVAAGDPDPETDANRLLFTF